MKEIRLTVDKLIQKKIFSVFDENGTLPLKPIYEKFDSEISYNELYILRLIYLNNNKK